MEPCNSSSSPINQPSQSPVSTNDKVQIKKTTSLLKLPVISKNPKNLKGRVSKNPNTLRVSVNNSLSLYSKPENIPGERSSRNSTDVRSLMASDGPIDRPSFDYGEYKIGVKREDLERQDSTYKSVGRHIAPIERKASTTRVPTIVERLNSLLAEKDEGKLKRTGDYALTFISTNILYWKEIDKIFLLGFIGERKAKSATKEALEYIHSELHALIKNGQQVDFQEAVGLFETLKENKICLQVFKDYPDLKLNYAHLLKMASLKEPV